MTTTTTLFDDDGGDGDGDDTDSSSSSSRQFVVPSLNGSLYLFDLGTRGGNLNKLHISAKQLVEISPFRDDDGSLYLSSKHTTIYGINAQTGKLLCKYGSPDPAQTSDSSPCSCSSYQRGNQHSHSDDDDDISNFDDDDSSVRFHREHNEDKQMILVVRVDYSVKVVSPSGKLRWNFTFSEIQNPHLHYREYHHYRHHHHHHHQDTNNLPDFIPFNADPNIFSTSDGSLYFLDSLVKGSSSRVLRFPSPVSDVFCRYHADSQFERMIFPTFLDSPSSGPFIPTSSSSTAMKGELMSIFIDHLNAGSHYDSMFAYVGEFSGQLFVLDNPLFTSQTERLLISNKLGIEQLQTEEERRQRSSQTIQGQATTTTLLLPGGPAGSVPAQTTENALTILDAHNRITLDNFVGVHLLTLDGRTGNDDSLPHRLGPALSLEKNHTPIETNQSIGDTTSATPFGILYQLLAVAMFGDDSRTPLLVLFVFGVIPVLGIWLYLTRLSQSQQEQQKQQQPQQQQQQIDPARPPHSRNRRKQATPPSLPTQPIQTPNPPISKLPESSPTHNKIQVGKLTIFLNKVLGHGSHGTVVFRGVMEGGREVAVKRMLSAFYAIASKEISLLIESDHHINILRYYAKEEDAQFVYLALELCPFTLEDLISLEGGDCDSVQQITESSDYCSTNMSADHRRQQQQRRRQFQRQYAPILHDVDARRDILRQITLAVQHLHSLNIVHRDLKPANILLIPSKVTTSRLCVKISDMGLGKLLPSNQSSFDTDISGSLGWQPPEVIEKSEQRRRMTKAVDVFAMGLLFHYVLSNGKHPFGERYERDVNILNGKDFVKTLLRNHSQDTQMLVQQMIAHKPELRLSCPKILAHPYFWSTEKKLFFLGDVSDQIGKEIAVGVTSEVARSLERRSPDIFRTSDENGVAAKEWKERLHASLLESIEKARRYDYTTIADLLRCIRNIRNHYREYPDEVQNLLSPLPNDGIFLYFTHQDRFPHLFMVVFEEVLRGKWHRLSNFRQYFTKVSNEIHDATS